MPPITTLPMCLRGIPCVEAEQVADHIQPGSSQAGGKPALPRESDRILDNDADGDRLHIESTIPPPAED